MGTTGTEYLPHGCFRDACGPSSETQLSIQVGPQGALPKNSFIRIRGLPAVVAISNGHAIAPGAWYVPLNGLQNLKIIVPVGVQGNSDVSISLVNVDGVVLAEARTLLMVHLASPAMAHQPALPGAIIIPDVDPSPLAAFQREFDLFLARGSVASKTRADHQTESGDVPEFSQLAGEPARSQGYCEVDLGKRGRGGHRQHCCQEHRNIGRGPKRGSPTP
jgi:hypothetical protein